MLASVCGYHPWQFLPTLFQGALNSTSIENGVSPSSILPDQTFLYEPRQTHVALVGGNLGFIGTHERKELIARHESLRAAVPQHRFDEQASNVDRGSVLIVGAF